jgi:DNA-binding NtrC family response regulator
VGGTREVRVNIRVIAATNKELKQAVKAGTFREDLFFRLHVVSLTLPPLRERVEDIAALAEYFLKRHVAEAKKPMMKFTDDSLIALRQYPWPGNIRELENAIARAVVLGTDELVRPESLGLTDTDGHTPSTGSVGMYTDLPYHESMEQHSRQIITRALRQSNGSQTRAAERLKLQRTYLARLIRQKSITPQSSKT